MVEDDGGENMIGDRNTKKVRFKGLDFDSEGPPNSGRDEHFELLDGDVVRTMVNGLAIQKKCARVWGLQRMLLWVKVKRWKTYWRNANPFGNDHFNPTFDSPVESIVELNNELLDSRRHSAITFEENVKLNNVNPIEVDILVGKGKGILVSKGRGSGIKGVFSEVVVLLVR
ncbi:hypothetical protein Gorai_000406 [Gossypium raimondii]|uniref:Uncharacterized protein n=1 Tax=Gossypium raimondii TaxID=29730 RepID=A0A7J8PDH1_GOSRA|nr:hypothetical protein [Gossypium raimondii]